MIATLALFVISIGSLTFLPAWLVHMIAARGTHARYLCRSIIRPTQWLNEANQVYQFFRNATGHGHSSHFWVLLDAFDVLLYGFWIWVFYQSDEDDWWQGRKRKLKKWAKKVIAKARKIKVRVPVPQPAPMPI